MKRRTLDITGAEDGWPLIRVLTERLALSASDGERLIAQGSVYVQGRRCKRALTQMRPGQTVSVVLSEGGRGTLEPAAQPSVRLDVLFQDDALVAINKSAGVPAQPTAAREGENLLEAVERWLGRPAGLVHRLDKDTTGVTVFGKTSDATASLAQQFRAGTARKRYLAVCGPGLPESGVVDLPLSKDPSRPGRFRATRAAHGVTALTEYLRLAQGEGYCLVALFPRTGRTHQLRAHLTALKAPILGDARYGGAPAVGNLPVPRSLLHAQGLLLAHPSTRQPLLVEAPLPEDMRPWFEAAGLEAPSGPW